MTNGITTNRVINVAMIIGFLVSASAFADNHFTRHVDELNRCVAAARAATIQDTTRQIRHFVTEEDTAGAWARFEIRTELYDVQGGPMVKEIASSCRAHRWDDKTVLEQ